MFLGTPSENRLNLSNLNEHNLFSEGVPKNIPRIFIIPLLFYFKYKVIIFLVIGKIVLRRKINMKKYVYLFNEGNSSMRELLGGKGANLAEMVNLRFASSTRIHYNNRKLQRLLRK